MDSLKILGGKELSGNVQVSSAKNSSLPILIASLLTDEPIIHLNLPDLRDILTTIRLLVNLGAEISVEGEKNIIQCRDIKSTEATYDLVKTMRASIVVRGP